MLSLSGLFFDACILYKLPLQLADAREEGEILESVQLTGSAKDLPVSLSLPTLLMIALLEFLIFEN